MLIARLRSIAEAMGLDPGQRCIIQAGVRISDLSGGGCKLTTVLDDVVQPNYLVDEIIAAGRDLRPVLVVVDPAVSFGVGESRVNDAEQGLIEAMRIFRNFLGCCVLGIHHTGKANAREKSLDQYAGRGGSAFSDGARMVAVMQPLEANEWEQATGTRLATGESGIVMALPKLTFCPPQEPIFIRRKGYAFSQETVIKRSRDQVSAAVAEQLWQFLTHEKDQGRTYAQRDLEAVASDINLKRAEIRAGTARLKAEGRLIEAGKPRTAGFHLDPIPLDKPCAETCAEDSAK